MAKANLRPPEQDDGKRSEHDDRRHLDNGVAFQAEDAPIQRGTSNGRRQASETTLMVLVRRAAVQEKICDLKRGEKAGVQPALQWGRLRYGGKG